MTSPTLRLVCALFSTVCLLPRLGAQTAIEPPVPVRTVPPDYPVDLRRDGVSGVVTLKCQIDPQGNVTGAEIEKSSNPGFESAAVAAVKKWKFKPAKRDGTAVPIQVSIPIKFVAEG